MRIKRILSFAEAKSYGLEQAHVSKAVDLDTKEIVGWVEGETGFDKTAAGIKVFHLLGTPEIFGDEPLKIYGTTLSAALIAMGLGVDDEEKWGDQRGWLERLKTNPEEIYVYRVDHIRLPQDEVDNAIDLALGRQQ